MRKAALLFAAMAASLLVASGIALAESQLDQEQTSHDTFWTVSRWNLLVGQTFTAGVSGQLDRVSILAGCCADREEVLRPGQPPGDVIVEVYAVDGSTGLPTGEVLGSGREPASSFPNNGSLDWVDVALDPAPGVEAGEQYALLVSSTENGITRGAWYAWGIVFPSAYSGGAFAVAGVSGGGPCPPPSGRDWDLLENDDAAFKTFVEPGVPTPAPQDVTAPDTCVSGPPNPIPGGRPDLTNDDTPTFSFSGSDNVTARKNLVYSYKVDDGDWSAYSPAKSVTLGDASGLPDGAYTFYLKARDEAGNEDASPAELDFEVDATAPTISGVDPARGETGVARGTDVTVTFSEAMYAGFVTASNFELYRLNKARQKWQRVSNVGVEIEPQASCDGVPCTRTASLDPYPSNPSKLLEQNTKYRAQIDTSPKDLAGNPLAQGQVWSFKTGSR